MWRLSATTPPKPKTTPATGDVNRLTGERNEKLAARRLGLRRVDGSGCGLREKGDLGSGSPFHVEAKATRLPELRLQHVWFRKAARQARLTGKPFAVLQLAFSVGAGVGGDGTRWVAVRAEDLRRPPRRVGALPRMTLGAADLTGRPPYRLWPQFDTCWLLFPESWFSPSRFRPATQP